MEQKTQSRHGSQSVDQAARLRDYWQVVWSGRYTVLTIVLLAVGFAILRVFLATPIYQATAVIEIKPEARSILPGQQQWVGADGRSWISEELYFNTQLEVLQSRDLAKRVFYQLRLSDDPGFTEVADPVGAFAGLISVRPKLNTRLVSVSVIGSDPNEATEWVNAISETYVRRNVDVAVESFSAIMDQIENSMREMGDTLSDADEARFQNSAQDEFYVPENQEEILKKNLETYNRELASVQVRLGGLDAEIEGLDRIRRAGGDLMSLPRFSQNPVVQSLNASKLNVERELERLAGEKKPRHPEYLAKLTDLDKIQQNMNEQIDQVSEELREEYRLAKSNASHLREEIRRTEELAHDVQKRTSSYELKRTGADSKRKLYDVVAETMEQLQLGSQMVNMNNNVAILDPAIVPRQPIRPRKLVTVAFGLFLGMIFGVGAVLFVDYLDNTIRTPDDIEQSLGLNVLAIVPKYRSASANALKEAYRSLRTSILFSSHNLDKKILLFTSAGPQEGKSSTVAQVSKSLASAGDRVILLDCDLRRPTAHTHLQVPREPGLTNFLLGGSEDELEGYIRQASVPNLDVMTSGPIPPNPTELVGAHRFRTLLGLLKKRYDWIIVDSPPVASLADTVVLASLVDMVVLVIKHNENDRELIRRCLKRLRDIDVEIAGAVLNGMDMQSSYGYYASYDYYEPTRDANKKRRRRLGAPRPGDNDAGRVAL